MSARTIEHLGRNLGDMYFTITTPLPSIAIKHFLWILTTCAGKELVIPGCSKDKENWNIVPS
jgi:hypothetical protein